MTSTFLPHTCGQSYVLPMELRTGRVPSSIRSAVPNEAEREELVLQKLGPKAWGRLHHFRHYYSSGWGEGRGQPLSPRSLEAFFRFLEAMPAFRHGTPSIFLTDHGHLELCWEDAGGKAVQVEFTPIHVQYYIEAQDVESSETHAAVALLAMRLGSL